MRAHDHQVLEEIVTRRGGFGHREHVELAWNYLQRYPYDDAAEAMIEAIRHVARAHGVPDKYHDTITRAWVHFVAVHRQRWGAEDFEAFIDRNPDLLDGGLIGHFYSPQLIGTEAARGAWTSPDLRALPVLH